MTRLSIGTLRGVAVEWLMIAGFIKTWANLEKLFLAHFFEDIEILVPTFLAIY